MKALGATGTTGQLALLLAETQEGKPKPGRGHALVGPAHRDRDLIHKPAQQLPVKALGATGTTGQLAQRHVEIYQVIRKQEAGPAMVVLAPLDWPLKLNRAQQRLVKALGATGATGLRALLLVKTRQVLHRPDQEPVPVVRAQLGLDQTPKPVIPLRAQLMPWAPILWLVLTS